jgi:hypothetical protein
MLADMMTPHSSSPQKFPEHFITVHDTSLDVKQQANMFPTAIHFVS